MWHKISAAHHILFLLHRFSVKYRFPFPILRFFTVNMVKSPALGQLKDRFLKKILSKIAKTMKTRRFFRKVIIGSNNSFTWKHFQVFKIAKFEFKVTVHYGLCTKCSQLWALRGLAFSTEGGPKYTGGHKFLERKLGGL